MINLEKDNNSEEFESRSPVASVFIVPLILEVAAWYSKYRNKGIGLKRLWWFPLFPLVVCMSVVCLWLSLEQTPSYALCTANFSLGGTDHPHPHRKPKTRCNSFLPLLHKLTSFSEVLICEICRCTLKKFKMFFFLSEKAKVRS